MKTSITYPSDLVVLRAMRKAVRRIVRERKKTGISLSVWKNGKVVSIPAAKIVVK